MSLPGKNECTDVLNVTLKGNVETKLTENISAEIPDLMVIPSQYILYRCLDERDGGRASLHLRKLWYAWIAPHDRMMKYLRSRLSTIAPRYKGALDVAILCSTP